MALRRRRDYVGETDYGKIITYALLICYVDDQVDVYNMQLILYILQIIFLNKLPTHVESV